MNTLEKAIEHNLYHLLHDDPNSEMTSFVFRETLMGHLLLWGNAFAQIIRDGRGRVLGLFLYCRIGWRWAVQRREISILIPWTSFIILNCLAANKGRKKFTLMKFCSSPQHNYAIIKA